jgi:uncharacterized OsmC-like protein
VLVDRQKLKANVDDLETKLSADPHFGHVWPHVATTLQSDVLSNSQFVQYGKEFEFRSDEAEARGGAGEAPSPLRYLLSSLAFCMQGFYAKASSITDVDLAGSDVGVLTYMDMRGEHRVGDVPPNPQWFVVEARFATESAESSVLKMVDEANARCPVRNLLSKAVPVYEQIYVNDRPVRDTVPSDVNANWTWRSPK